MRKILFAIATLSLVSACQKAGDDQAEAQQVQDEPQNNGHLSKLSYTDDTEQFFRDDETGCEYIGTLNGITARLDSSGRPICNDPSEGDDQ